MRAVAAWLIARPQHAIIGLAATLLLPLSTVVSGTVMALLVLGQGAVPAALQGAVAIAILSASSAIVGAPVSHVLSNGIVIWVPAMLLAALLRRWRSLALTLQLWVIAALAATIAFHAVLGDPAAFWTDALARLSEWLRGLSFAQSANLLHAGRQELAPYMTIVAVVLSWSTYAMVLLFGYAVYRAVPGKTADFGLFRDLNLGRVLAVIMAAAGIVSLVTGAAWLEDLAFVSFAVFWLQGLAIVHWLHARRRLPRAVVVLIYALLPILGARWIIGLALAGYLDAWFGFRFRLQAR